MVNAQYLSHTEEIELHRMIARFNAVTDSARWPVSKRMNMVYLGGGTEHNPEEQGAGTSRLNKRKPETT